MKVGDKNSAKVENVAKRKNNEAVTQTMCMVKDIQKSQLLEKKYCKKCYLIGIILFDPSKTEKGHYIMINNDCHYAPWRDLATSQPFKSLV